MPKIKSPFQKAAGKLVSAIQKEWGEDLGGPRADFSEDVMGAAHKLLQAGTSENARTLLGARSVAQYLGEIWIQSHPGTKPAVAALEHLVGRHGMDDM